MKRETVPPDLSPFARPLGPSIFAQDPACKAQIGGLSRSQVASRTVRARTVRTGTSPGHIWGLSTKPNQLVERPRKARP